MKSICIATDLHGDADRALARAVRLAQMHNARLCVISVLPDTCRDADVMKRQSVLETMVGDLSGSDALETEVLVSTGEVVAEVHHAAAHAEAELIVLGPHHQGGLLDALRMTTLERLVRDARIPVLLAISPAATEYASVLAPVDFSPACAAALEAARSVAPAAQITLTHSVGVPYQTIIAAPGAVGDVSPMADPAPFIEDARLRASAWLAENAALSGLTPPEPDTRSLPHLVAEMRAATGADLICLGGHTKQGVLDRLLGSFTSELVRDPPCDLLIAPAG